MTILRTLCLLLLSCSALAQSPAVIRSVTSSGGALTITGDNFIQLRGRYDVLLGSVPLAPTSYTADTIVALLPGPLAVGTYLLELVPQRGNAIAGDEFAYVVAAVGAKGDTGPTGPQGIAGPQGSMGQIGLAGNTGATGATGPAGPEGPQGSSGAPGPQGDSGTSGQSAVTVSFNNAHVDVAASFPIDAKETALLPAILNAQVNVTRVPADIVATFKASVGQTDFNTVQCAAGYLFRFNDAWTMEHLNLPSLTILQPPFIQTTTFTTHTITQSMTATVAGTYPVVVKVATACAAYVESASLTVMVLNR